MEKKRKSRIVTYRDRGRIQALIWSIPALFFVVTGFYFGITQSNWAILVCGVVAAVAVIVYIRSNERVHRDDP